MKNFFQIIGVLMCSSSIAQNIAGDSLLNDTTVHTIYLDFSQPSYWSDLVNNKAFDDANDSSTYIPASVIVDGQSFDSVGVQFKGNSSYYGYPSNKKPFTLSFNEYISGQKCNGLKSLNLNNLYQDPSFMREKMFLDFCQEKGIYAPRANYARLYINGSYWGLYIMVERINKDFLKDRFEDNDGNLWKGDNSTSACADLKYHGSISSYYNCYELKTNEVANDWSKLVNLTYQINMTTNADFRDSVEAVMNTNSFISAWAGYNLFVDFDSYPYRFIHNYYIYHDSITDKFQFIVWDVSTAFGMDIPMSIPQIENISVLYVTPQATDRPLVNRMLSDSIYKDTYLSTICSFANNDFLPAKLYAKIDSLYNRINYWVYSDPLKMYSNSNFDNNINVNINVGGIDYPGLKSFILNRSNSVIAELDSLGYSNCPAIFNSIEETSTTSDLYMKLFPNPTKGIFNVQLNAIENLSIAVFSITGKNVFQISGSANNFTIDLSNLSSGIYFVKVQSKNSFSVRKLVID